MKCIDLIVQDHIVLRRALDIVDRMLAKLEYGERIEIADAATVLTFLRLFGHEYHEAMEETVLFPALLRAVGQEGPLHQLVHEHGEERMLVLDIEDAVKCRRGMDFLRNSRRLTAQLKNHFEKENVILS